MTNIYTAVTIGPIYKTLSLATKTRELWGASYLFSFIMRRIIEELKDTSKCCLPYHTNLLKEGLGKGAGLFPDRLIYLSDVKKEISSIEQTIINELAIKTDLPVDYLQNYIRIYTVSFQLPVSISTKESDNNNIVIVANRLLDTLELKEKIYTKDVSQINWSTAIDKINGKLFYTEAKIRERQFPSIIEIATSDFRQKNQGKYNELVECYLKDQDENAQKDFLKQLKNKDDFMPISVRPYHKYIAVIQADGDNIGKTIGIIGDNTKTVRDFSAALFEFALEAVEKIKNYGGKAVYVGGDDLLFFAPVAIYSANQETPSLTTVFGLINELDKAFEAKIINNENLKHLYMNGGALRDKDKRPSMSYGVSITYSKYPLNEAREATFNLLHQAKYEIKDDKNKICFKLHKHSGQGFGFTVDKKMASSSTPRSFNYFLKMVTRIPLQDKLLSSIIYKLAPLHELLNLIVHDKLRLDTFFDQELELDKIKEKEESKRTAEEKAKLDFIENVVNYYYQLSVDFPNANIPLPEKETEISDSNIAKLYSTLRFMKQLTDEDDGH